jgi:hypothetical protein
MKYESNSKNDEAVHQNAAQNSIAFAFYRRSRSRINYWLHYYHHQY